MHSTLRTVSWILLALVGGLNLLGALASAGVALSGSRDGIGPTTVEELAAGRERVATALRARRLTAAAYAAAFGVMLLFVAAVPYRRGDVWAWWAVLAGTLTLCLLVMARVPFIGTASGARTYLVMLVVVALGLALDAGRLRASQPPSQVPQAAP
jgi:hypothetical protein